MPELEPPVWRDAAGQPLGCREKLRVLDENPEEIRSLAQNALENAVLMGCDEGQVRGVLHRLVEALENPYTEESA